MAEYIASCGDLEKLVRKYGLLPFFKNDISGFSVEEHTPPRLWFSAAEDGPWEWKGPVAQNCVYGKLFGKKAGFASLELFADLANVRRGGYDFDARFDDGLAPMKDKQVYDVIAAAGTITTTPLKRECGYVRDGKKGYEGVITRLQMQTYVCISDFDYAADRNGNRRGWGMARYSTPEARFGAELVRAAYARTADESVRRLVDFMKKAVPAASEAQLEALIAG